MTEGTREFWFSAIGYAAVACTAVIGILTIWCLSPGFRRRWLPLPRLRSGRWDGRDVLLAFCIVLGVQALAPALLLQTQIDIPANLDAKDPKVRAALFRADLLSSPVTFPLILTLVVAVLYVRTRTLPCHYGLSKARWPANVAVGLAVFLAVTPVVLGLHWAATQILGEQPHALSVFGKSGPAEWEWCLIGLRVIVIAPILEEILYRGILQGWLRYASLPGHFVVGLAAIFVVVAQAPQDGLPTDLASAGPYVLAFGLACLYAYAVVRRLSGDANGHVAVLGSAMLFSVSHTAAWPAPIALFVLGLALGQLARRTQSLVGPIVLHAAFNLVSFIALFAVTHYAVDENGNAQAMADRPATLTSVPTSQLPLRK